MALASRGLRDMDEGPEPLEEAAAEAVRGQARDIRRRALAAGALAAALAWLTG